MSTQKIEKSRGIPDRLQTAGRQRAVLRTGIVLFLRRQESKELMLTYSVWIPAFAGMTMFLQTCKLTTPPFENAYF
jgi:hypothetical protein